MKYWLIRSLLWCEEHNGNLFGIAGAVTLCTQVPIQEPGISLLSNIRPAKRILTRLLRGRTSGIDQALTGRNV